MVRTNPHAAFARRKQLISSSGARLRLYLNTELSLPGGKPRGFESHSHQSFFGQFLVSLLSYVQYLVDIGVGVEYHEYDGLCPRSLSILSELWTVKQERGKALFVSLIQCTYSSHIIYDKTGRYGMFAIEIYVLGGIRNLISHPHLSLPLIHSHMLYNNQIAFLHSAPLLSSLFPSSLLPSLMLSGFHF